jgi:hypothetical protein
MSDLDLAQMVETDFETAFFDEVEKQKMPVRDASTLLDYLQPNHH